MSFNTENTNNSGVFFLARLKHEKEHARFYYTHGDELKCIHAYPIEGNDIEVTVKTVYSTNTENLENIEYKEYLKYIKTKKAPLLPFHSIHWHVDPDEEIEINDIQANGQYHRLKNNCLTYLIEAILPKFNTYIPREYYELYGATIPSRLIHNEDDSKIWHARLPSQEVFRLSTHLVKSNMQALLQNKEYLKELQGHLPLQRQVIFHLNEKYNKTEIIEMAGIDAKENIDILLNINKKETKHLKQKIQQLKKQIQKLANKKQKIKDKLKKIQNYPVFKKIKSIYREYLILTEQDLSKIINKHYDAYLAFPKLLKKLKPLIQKQKEQKSRQAKKSGELKQHLQFFTHKDPFEILGVLRKKKFLHIRSMQDECHRFAKLLKQADIHEDFNFKHKNVHALVNTAVEKNSPALALYILTTGGSRNLRFGKYRYLSDDLTTKDLLKLVDTFKNDQEVMNAIFKKRGVFGGRDFWKLFKTAEHFSKLAEYANESDCLKHKLNHHPSLKANMNKAAQKLLKEHGEHHLDTKDEQIIQNRKFLLNILNNRAFYDTVTSNYEPDRFVIFYNIHLSLQKKYSKKKLVDKNTYEKIIIPKINKKHSSGNLLDKLQKEINNDKAMLANETNKVKEITTRTKNASLNIDYHRFIKNKKSPTLKV